MKSEIIDMPTKFFAVEHYAELMGKAGIDELCKLLDTEQRDRLYL